MDQAQVSDRYHEDEYNATAWNMASTGYQSPQLVSPAHEYSNFNFQTGAMPMAGIYGNPMNPSPQQSFTPTWPSMLMNPSHNDRAPMHTNQMAQMPYAPPGPLPPLITTPVPPPQQQSSSRRTLTDQDRRRMCRYHEENPTVKQTEIGAMFGVERSTVSKVLRQKEKYLAVDDGSKSPGRRAKGKFPDIERALTNWAMKHKQKGMALSDDAIREKARFFAASVGSPEASMKVNSSSWLEKFKQKNHIGPSKQKRGTSAGADPESGLPSGVQTPNGVSPISPGGLNLSPVVDSPVAQKLESSSVAVGQLGHSKSTTSLASGFSDANTPFSAVSQPPLPERHDRSSVMGSTGEAFRPRSQTFPRPGIETIQPDLSENLTDAQIEEIMAHSALDTPHDEYPERSQSVASLSSTDLPHLQQSHSGTPAMDNSPVMMRPPSNALHSTSATSSNVASPVAPPTLDDGKRGLQMAMCFLTTLPSGSVEPQEYMLLAKLMDKLDKLDKLGPRTGEMPGGMHSISVKRDMARKRSIHSL